MSALTDSERTILRLRGQEVAEIEWDALVPESDGPTVWSRGNAEPWHCFSRSRWEEIVDADEQDECESIIDDASAARWDELRGERETMIAERMSSVDYGDTDAVVDALLSLRDVPGLAIADDSEALARAWRRVASIIDVSIDATRRVESALRRLPFAYGRDPVAMPGVRAQLRPRSGP